MKFEIGARVYFGRNKKDTGTVLEAIEDDIFIIEWDNHVVDGPFYENVLQLVEDPFVTWTKKVRSKHKKVKSKCD